MYQSGYASYDSLTGYYDFLFRSYDPALGRFFAFDPMAASTPSYSPYHANFNNPISFTDPLGLSPNDGRLKDFGFNSGEEVNFSEGVSSYEYWARPSMFGENIGSSVGDFIAAIVGELMKSDFGGQWTQDGGMVAYDDPTSSESENNQDGNGDIQTKPGVFGFTGESIVVKSDGEKKSEESRTVLQIANDIAYEINEYNPLAIAINSIHAYFTGKDWERGNPMSAGEASFNLATIIPVFKVGKVVKKGFNITRKVVGNQVLSVSGHASQQAITRGFSPASIKHIIQHGSIQTKLGKGLTPQFHYSFGGNTVIVNSLNGRIITMFSSSPGTRNGLGAGNFIPFNIGPN
ncbi:RHS repeat domain-containing protein [Ekhidna sp. To15]|uniref:RHS repeat domain-containing protein n=1 Tax=Ekhidna sp. To15 TaxID=3395267 RepID=UPI003F522074